MGVEARANRRDEFGAAWPSYLHRLGRWHVATYVLMHGGGSGSWYWHRVAPRLQALGHEVIAPDLPCDDDAAGLEEYADAVVQAVGGRSGIVLVAQSMAGLSAPIVATRVPTDLLVLVAAMIPAPGEIPGEWWTATGQVQADASSTSGRAATPTRRPIPACSSCTTCPRTSSRRPSPARGERDQSGTPFTRPWPLPAWPDVPTRVLIASRDRLFPVGFQRRLARERLGVTPEEIDTGHLPALVDPEELVRRLEAYRFDQEQAAET